jgi:inhibitor of KinA sporulation pathway (predicted exonuclease)
MQRSARQNGRSLPLKLNVGETQEEVLDVLALVESPYEVVVSGKLDQLVVVDLEATCWENDPPDGQESEIIEIGICTVDIRTGERLDRESVLVRPERSQVSLFCTQLTTLTQAQVDGGLSFAEACQHLRAQYQTRERVWASYGDYDRRLFQRQCLDRGVPYPFGHTHVNIKNLVALIQGLPREVGLVHAIGIMGLPLEGTHHRGVDDAWNAALLIATLIMQRRNDLNA